MVQAWTDLPLDRPISIECQDNLSTEMMHGAGPAVVACAVELCRRPAQVVSDLLEHLDDVARALFPAWLPDAVRIDHASGAGIPAVRSIALRSAERTGQYGPFLADLAERALRKRVSVFGRFSPEIRASSLASVIANSFGRGRTVLHIQVAAGLSDEDEQSLALAARWFTDHGRFGVWLTGAPVDTIETIGFASHAAETPEAPAAGRYPPVAGQPHPASAAERLLEVALSAAEWAGGREWNQPYQPHPLTNPVRVDLIWRVERCIVEIDGTEHREAVRFAEDRQRDVLLQLGGYAVLRFTNDQVIHHRDLVVSQIRQFLDGRRAEHLERVINA